MKKRPLPWVAAVAVTLLFVLTAYSQEDIRSIDNRVFGHPERPPSVFVHEEHNEAAGIEACNECHHVWENGQKLEDESSEDQSCADCHKLKKTEGKPALMNAFHRNCKGCHEQRRQGPVLCGECHVKQ